MWPFTHPVSPARRARRRRLELDPLEARVTPASLLVNTIADNTARDSTLTLREAIALVNKGGNAVAALGRNLTAGEVTAISGVFGSGDTIAFAATLNNQTIRLNGSQLNITRSVIISTVYPFALTIDANNASRAFEIDDGTPNAIDVQFLGSPPGLRVINGNARGGGGAIANAENLTLRECQLVNNRATFGGGISNTGTLRISAEFASLQGNSAAEGHGGGAIFNTGSLFISGFVSISGNRATYGGAIDNYGGSVSLTEVNFSDNTATGFDGGGAILNSGQLRVFGGVFRNNSADTGYGGALHNFGGTMTITSGRYENNHALAGGALFNDDDSTIVLTGGAFAHNFVREGNGGGAVYNRGTFGANGGFFDSNTASYGGAFCNAGGTANLMNGGFTFNTANGSDGGGAILNTAAMTLTNVTIDNNSSKGEGGGIANHGNLELMNCRLRFNRVDSDNTGDGHGGGIYSTSVNVVFLHNCTLTSNFVGTGGLTNDLFGGPFTLD